MTEGQPRIAIIGAGKIVEVGHLPGFVKADAPVVALCASSPDNLNRVADAFEIERRYTDWRQMLADGGFDAVSICTPPSLHKEMTVASLRQGYHVLLEKPIAVSLDECDAMIEAADSAQRILMMAHNQRFRMQHIIAKEILETGRLGQIRRVHAVFAHGGPERWSPNQKWYFDPQRAGYGVLIDLGYHKIDLLRWLLEQEVTDIRAFTATFEKPTSADDTVVAILQFDRGTLATLQASWAHHPDVPDSVVMACENGTLTIPSNPTEPVRVVEQRGSEIVEATYACNTSDGPGWFGAVAAFVDAVRHSKTSPVPATAGKATLAAVLRAYEGLGVQRSG